jgi:hypothetical protein
MSAGEPSGPGPDGRHDDLAPAVSDDHEPSSVVVPDDASSLDDDRRTLLAELRARAVDSSATTDRRWRPSWIGVVALAVTAVGAFGYLPSVLSPAMRASAPLPLADVGRPAGEVGGLLPDAVVVADDVSVPARILRPSVFMLVPQSCAQCAQRVASIYQQAQQAGLRVYLIAESSAEVVEGVARDAGATRAHVLTNPDGMLAAAYDRSGGLEVVVVRGDGIVTDVVDDPPASVRLGPLVSASVAGG